MTMVVTMMIVGVIGVQVTVRAAIGSRSALFHRVP